MLKRSLKINKKTVIDLLVLMLIIALISLAAAAVLYALDIIYFDDGIRLNLALFDSFKSSWYGWLIVIAAQVLLTTLLCFVPGTTMTFLVLIQMLYESPWQAFLISFIGVTLSSVIMYLTGKYGGRRLCERVLGKENCQKADELLNHKGIAFFPVMMLLPLFPDDALVMIAGTINMSMKWFLPSIILGRGIGVASIIFGFGSIPYERFTTPLHWILFVLAAAAVLAGAFFIAYKLNQYINRKK